MEIGFRGKKLQLIDMSILSILLNHGSECHIYRVLIFSNLDGKGVRVCVSFRVDNYWVECGNFALAKMAGWLISDADPENTDAYIIIQS